MSSIIGVIERMVIYDVGSGGGRVVVVA